MPALIPVVVDIDCSLFAKHLLFTLQKVEATSMLWSMRKLRPRDVICVSRWARGQEDGGMRDAQNPGILCLFKDPWSFDYAVSLGTYVFPLSFLQEH